MPENDHKWVHWSSVFLLVEEADWALSHTNKFCRFLNFPPDYYQRNRNNTSCARYKVYGVDRLSDNWNLYKAESTHPKSTLYLASVENMVALIIVMTGDNIQAEGFCLTRFSDWETSNIQANNVISV